MPPWLRGVIRQGYDQTHTNNVPRVTSPYDLTPLGSGSKLEQAEAVLLGGCPLTDDLDLGPESHSTPLGLLPFLQNGTRTGARYDRGWMGMFYSLDKSGVSWISPVARREMNL